MSHDALAFVHTDSAPKAVGPYSQAVIATRGGAMVYCAGQIPLDPATMTLVTSGISDETRRVLTNLRAVLEAAGARLDTVVKTTVFLTDLADFAEMNAVYAEVFGDHRPARSTIAVSGLPKGARVEIEAIAAVASP